MQERYAVAVPIRAALLCACLSACGTAGPRPWIDLLPEQGVSGMAVLPTAEGGERRAIVVHDGKRSPEELDWPRLGLIRARGSSVDYVTVDVEWGVSGPASDLEGTCLVPGTDDELLATEAGYYQGEHGRLFHLRLEGPPEAPAARWLAATQLPTTIREAEGLVCLPGGTPGQVLIVIGERDVSEGRAFLKWARIDLSSLPDTLALTAVEFAGAGTLDFTRVISDLYLDEGRRLWAAAVEDGGETGPFHSVVYLLGSVNPDAPVPLDLLARPLVVAYVEHLKIEGLGGPVVPGSWMSVGTEDETLGASWFPLFAPRIRFRHR